MEVQDMDTKRVIPTHIIIPHTWIREELDIIQDADRRYKRYTRLEMLVYAALFVAFVIWAYYYY